jgi:hypothetical protein
VEEGVAVQEAAPSERTVRQLLVEKSGGLEDVVLMDLNDITLSLH